MIIKPPGQEIPRKRVPEEKSHGKCSFKVELPLTPDEMAREKHKENLELKALNCILYPVLREKLPLSSKPTLRNPLVLIPHQGNTQEPNSQLEGNEKPGIFMQFHRSLKRKSEGSSKRGRNTQWMGWDEDFQGSARGLLKKDLSLKRNSWIKSLGQNS